MNPARILIVEDEQITAADLEDTLETLGHTVVGTAATAADAIRLAETLSPELVLMDIRLKGAMDGVEAATEIRERLGVRSIYLTAHADDATVRRAVGAEPAGYLVKPFDAAELGAAVQVALQNVRVDERTRDGGEQLAATLDSMASCVVRVDSAGRVTYLNMSASDQTGWPADESVGRHVNEVVRLRDGQNRDTLAILMQQVLHNRSVLELPEGVVLENRTGRSHRVCGCLAPVDDSMQGGAGAVLAFSRESHANESPEAPAAGATQDVIAESPAMRDVLRFARRIAASGVTTILIQGESGVGKDVLARYVHEHSPRRQREFVSVNCAAIPESLLESELFGYERGAFTDARSQKRGVLEMAPGGTVFLDEIGELQPQLQAKLLHVLEHQTFRRLGGLKDIRVDLRIVAASNVDLAAAVRAKEFREDLFYRLNVIQILIPPLRNRPEDILPLAEHFIEHYNRKFGRNIQGTTNEVRQMMREYAWPGNVRELRNSVERAMVLEESSEVTSSSLDLGLHDVLRDGAAPPSGDSSLEEVERSMLVGALEKCGGNQSRAARALGISRDTLRYRIKKHGI